MAVVMINRKQALFVILAAHAALRDQAEDFTKLYGERGYELAEQGIAALCEQFKFPDPKDQ